MRLTDAEDEFTQGSAFFYLRFFFIFGSNFKASDYGLNQGWDRREERERELQRVSSIELGEMWVNIAQLYNVSPPIW